MKVRLATLEDQEQVETLNQLDPAVKDFKYLWRLFKNWKPNSMPIVAEKDEKLVGFHAASFGKKYVNSFYQFTHKKIRGQRVGGEMVAFLLTEAKRLEIPRLKFKVPFESDGRIFWEGFGVVPFALIPWPEELLFDICLSSVWEPSDLKGKGKYVPTRTLEQFKLKGAVIL